MSPDEVRAEDVLTVAAALVLVTFLGVKSMRLHLNEQNYWDFAFILLPIALLVLQASIRYAFRPIGAPAIREVGAQTGSIFRDWSPFLIFLMLYESFRLNTWKLASPVDKDAFLLHVDRMLFGETPSVAFDAWTRGWLTQLMTIAYFTHLILPPIIALLWYRRDLRVFREFLLAVLVGAIIGALGYMLVPAIGPNIAFPSLYRHALSGGVYHNITAMLDSARATRDVFPSLHVGISTIVLWYAWRHGRAVFIATLPIVVANWFSTIYLRYHYLIDVIAGWLTALIAIALAAWILRVEEDVLRRIRTRKSAAALRSTAPPPPSPR